MAEKSIYADIAKRTGGDIYIGVVGPVRSGKSTFITRFMNELVLPNMGEGYSRERARDEMPQSAAGVTVMTTEPKFVPDEAVLLTLSDGATLRVKMIDCVGYMIPAALGAMENGTARMVHTPWQEAPMPFEEAAELGTRKVMSEHATIGMLVSSDGTVGEIGREDYVKAEERLVGELKELGKPFAIILNAADPTRAESISLAESLEEKYGVPVALVNCLTLDAEDIRSILSMVLAEFPVASMGISMPSFLSALPDDHPLRLSLTDEICRLAGEVSRMGEVATVFKKLSENPHVEAVNVTALDMGNGRANLEIRFPQSLYFELLSEMAGQEVKEEGALFSLVRKLSDIRRKYDRIESALMAAESTGYGIVMPEKEDLCLERPSVVKQSGGWGVRLRAGARSIHMIRTDITAEINPIVGTEQQSEEFLHTVLSKLEEEPDGIWESNFFGRSLYELVGDSLSEKLAHMPEDARRKLSETLSRIINEGSNGLLCILL